MAEATSKFNTYMLRGLPNGLFGETYAIVAGTQGAQGIYTGEYFILMKRPAETLHKGEVHSSDWAFPSELGTVNTDFAIDKGYRQAEMDLSLLLETRAVEIGRPDVAYLPFELKKCTSPLVSCWIRGAFTKQMMAIKDITKCPPLARYLSLLTQISMTIRPS